jgi:hypothetical protein
VIRKRPQGPGESVLLLLQVVTLLEKEKIEYAVVGGIAAAVHGAIRATTDADVLLAVAPSRLTALEKRIKAAGLGTEIRRGDPDDPIVAMLVVSDRYENRVELLAGIRGMDPKAFTRRQRVPFQGATLEVIGREDFIAMKCFAGGPLDLADARHVLKSPDVALDLDLLRRLTRRFGRAAADALEQLLA